MTKKKQNFKDYFSFFFLQYILITVRFSFTKQNRVFCKDPNLYHSFLSSLEADSSKKSSDLTYHVMRYRSVFRCIELGGSAVVMFPNV